MQRLIGLSFLLVCGLAQADVVVTKDGRKIEGRVTEQGDEVVVEQKLGSVRIPLADVERIEDSVDVPGKPDPKLELERLRLTLADGTADERYRFAVYARDNGFTRDAERAFTSVLSADPNHPGARAALGYVHHEGYWVLGRDLYRSQGLVEYRGEWLTPAERNRRIAAAKAARDAKEDAKVDAKLAELRAKAAAREAELEALRARRDEVRKETLEALGEYSEARSKADLWINNTPQWGWRSGRWGWGGWVPGLGYPPFGTPGIRPPLVWPPTTGPGVRPPFGRPPTWRPPQILPQPGGTVPRPSTQPLPLRLPRR